MTLSEIARTAGRPKGQTSRKDAAQDAVQTALVIPDTHVPLEDKAAVDVVLQALSIVRPDTLVHLGDLGEWESCSHWRWSRRRKPPLEYLIPEIDADFAAVQLWLDRLDAACKAAGVSRRVLLTGNHDEWVNRVVEEYPYLAGTHGLEVGLRLKARGWEVHPEGDFYRLGDLHLTHGSVGPAGTHHTRRRAMGWGVSTLYGHGHDVQVSSHGTVGGVIQATSLGCLKKLDRAANPWLKGQPTAWSHAFGLVHVVDGHAHLQIVPIIHGRAIVNGYLLTGKG